MPGRSTGRYNVSASQRLELHEGERDHAQKQQAVPESRNLRLAVFARRVADRYFGGPQVELAGSKDKIKVAEVMAVTCDFLIVATQQRLRAAQCVGVTLVQEIGEQQREYVIGEQV